MVKCNEYLSILTFDFLRLFHLFYFTCAFVLSLQPPLQALQRTWLQSGQAVSKALTGNREDVHALLCFLSRSKGRLDCSKHHSDLNHQTRGSVVNKNNQMFLFTTAILIVFQQNYLCLQCKHADRDHFAFHTATAVSIGINMRKKTRTFQIKYVDSELKQTRPLT